jgi:hypothetical protein
MRGAELERAVVRFLGCRMVAHEADPQDLVCAAVEHA